MRTTRLVARLPVVLLVLGCLGQAILALNFASRGWFGVDALHFIGTRGGLVESDEGLLDPYAGHWVTTLVLVYRLLFETFGLSHYLAFVVPTVACHLGICMMLFLLCRRLGTSPWVSLAAVWPLLFFGMGSEAYLFDAPLALTATLLIGLVAIWVLLRRDGDDRALLTALALLLLGLTVSAGGVVTVVLVGAVALSLYGWRRALLLCGVPAVVFVVWYVGWGRHEPRVSPTGADLLELPQLALTLVAAPLGSAVGVPAVGGALVLLVVGAVFFVRDVPAPMRALALAGVVAVLVNATLSALAAVQLFDGAVEVGRYQYVVLALLVPAIAVALTGGLRLARERSADVAPALPVVIGLLLVAGLTVHGVAEERRQAQTTQGFGDKARAWTKGGVAASALGEAMLDPEAGGYVLHGHDLVNLARAGAAQWPELKPTGQERLEAEVLFYTGMAPDSFGLSEPAELSSTTFDPALRADGGCQLVRATAFTPSLELTTFQEGEITVTSASSSVTATLTRDGLSSAPRVWPVTPGQTLHFATSAQLATLRLTFDAAGDFTICSS